MQISQARPTLVLLSASLFAFSSCSPTASSQPASSPPQAQAQAQSRTSDANKPEGSATADKPTAQEDRAAIQAQSRRFSQAYVDGDHETLVSIYAEDATLGPAGRDFVQGSEAVRAFWKPAPGKVHRHAMVPDKLVVDGDHAYDRGRYSGSASGPDAKAPKDFGGNYLVVWRRDADGVWRMVEDVWYGMNKSE